MKNYGFNNAEADTMSNHIFYDKICKRLKQILVDEEILTEEDGSLILIEKLLRELFIKENELIIAQQELSSLKTDVDEHLSKWIEEIQK